MCMFFIMQCSGGLSWQCDYVLSANQPILVWGSFFTLVAACIILVLHCHMLALYFVVVRGCTGLICFL